MKLYCTFVFQQTATELTSDHVFIKESTATEENGDVVQTELETQSNHPVELKVRFVLRLFESKSTITTIQLQFKMTLS